MQVFSPNHDYLAVSLSQGRLKVARVQSPATVVNAITVDLTGVPESDHLKIIRNACAPFKTRGEILYVIPASSMTIKNIEIPSTDPDEIQSIARLQAARHTPLAKDEIQTGFLPRCVYKENFTKGLLIIAHKNEIIRQLTVLQQAGIRVSRVVFAPEAIAQFYARAFSLGGHPRPVGIIDVGDEATIFILAFHGVLIASRHIPMGKIHLNNRDALDKLADELSRTMELFKAEDIEIPDQYFLTSDSRHTQELQGRLKEKLGWNAAVSPYVGVIKLSNNILKKFIDDSSVLDVIACAATGATLQVNLMPAPMRDEGIARLQRRELQKAAVLGLIALVLVGCIFGLKIYFQTGFLNKLKNHYEAAHAEVEALERQSAKIKIIQGFLNKRMASLDVISELHRYLPQEIYLTSVAMDEEGRVIIQGVSDAAARVFNLGVTLKKSPLFESVDIKSTTAKKSGGQEATSFEIVMRLLTTNEK